MDKLYVKANLEWENEKLVAIASTAVEDRHGETVSVEGWDLKNFKRNPVLLWGHDYTQPAVGKAEKVWVEGAGKKARLMIQPIFQEVTELGRAVKQLVTDGFIRSLSVGFKPIDQDGTAYTKQELLEVSFVNVPANPEAMMLAYKSLRQADFEADTIAKLVDAEMAEYLANQEQRMGVLEAKVDSAVKGLQYLNPPAGRGREALIERQTMAKAIAKASDSLLSSNKDSRIKIIKIASERIIVSQKEELDGKNQRPSSQKVRQRAD